MYEKLAIEGGMPITKRSWPAFNSIDDSEKTEVMDVLNSGVLSDFTASPGDKFLGGPKVKALEKAWSEYFNVPYAISMNSCTSCLYAALLALNIGKDDEVILPQLGMCTIATVVLLAGAKPIFADCHPKTMLIEPSSIESLITEKSKAIIAVHLAGHPAPMHDILKIARKNDLYVIEDNAQSPGALYNGMYTGAIGDIGCFSLNCHKIIQCGEGGVACTHNSEIALKLQLIRNHGEKCISGFGLEKLNVLGLNLRLTELQAAVAIHQLAKLQDLNFKTCELAKYLTDNLKFKEISPPTVEKNCTHVYYIFHWEYIANEIGISAALFAKALQHEGVPVYANYGYLISELPSFRHLQKRNNLNDAFPGACYAIKNSLWTMILRPNLTIKDVDTLIKAIKKVFDKRDSIISNEK